jgi:predicted fused transcriptional regulator/phosphomethylpyrimidine kinase/predicted transcriptional regulator
MHPPSEMMVDSFLPAMRETVARRLSEEGLSQGKIAGLLGVTQASVSLYLKSGGRAAQLLRGLEISEEDGRLYASLLAEDLKKNPVYAESTLYSLWSDLLGRGSLCPPHRSLYPQLAECDVCIKAFGGRESRSGDAVEHVAEAVRMVEGSSEFVQIMPEVSVNIAYAPEGATSVQGIVAIPGRIVRVRGRARSFMRPEYGASTHVANVLLAAMSHDGSIRASINLRFDKRMSRVLRRLKMHPLLLKEAGVKSDSEMIGSLRAALGGAMGPVGAVVDPGAPGLEPGLYLFAHDALEVARQGLKVARSYAAER